jgi:hypothetical protein
MTDIQSGRPGVQNISDGSENYPRSTRTGELGMSPVHGTFLEALRTGNLWTISTPLAGITVTANMLTSVASSNCIVGVYNKSGGAYLHITRLNIVVASAATATGFVWGFNTPTTYTTLPTGVAKAYSHRGQTKGNSPYAIAFDGSVAVSGGAATDLVRPILCGQINLPLNAEETDDDLIVPPLGFLGVFGDTVTTATVVKASLTWEEVPI